MRRKFSCQRDRSAQPPLYESGGFGGDFCQNARINKRPTEWTAPPPSASEFTLAGSIQRFTVAAVAIVRWRSVTGSGERTCVSLRSLRPPVKEDQDREPGTWIIRAFRSKGKRPPAGPRPILLTRPTAPHPRRMRRATCPPSRSAKSARALGQPPRSSRAPHLSPRAAPGTPL